MASDAQALSFEPPDGLEALGVAIDSGLGLVVFGLELHGGGIEEPQEPLTVKFVHPGFPVPGE